VVQVFSLVAPCCRSLTLAHPSYFFLYSPCWLFCSFHRKFWTFIYSGLRPMEFAPALPAASGRSYFRPSPPSLDSVSPLSPSGLAPSRSYPFPILVFPAPRRPSFLVLEGRQRRLYVSPLTFSHEQKILFLFRVCGRGNDFPPRLTSARLAYVFFFFCLRFYGLPLTQTSYTRYDVVSRLLGMVCTPICQPNLSFSFGEFPRCLRVFSTDAYFSPS